MGGFLLLHWKNGYGVKTGCICIGKNVCGVDKVIVRKYAMDVKGDQEVLYFI